MDVDNDPVDQNLLLQFTCLGTTDRDDLVKQFQELIKVNGTTASFFLEMNNWNLQNAICSFLDYGTAHNLPVMSVEECCKQLNYENPRSSCVMWWTLRNDGTEPWPDNCSLQYASGNHRCDMKTIPVTHVVYPKHSTTVVIYFTAPKEPGCYHSIWRMMTAAGTYFGEVLNVTFEVREQLDDPVEASLSEELASRMALNESAYMEDEHNFESNNTVINILSNSSKIDKENMPDEENRGDKDQEISWLK